ncbi:uncharacterized protein DUF4292 [Gillisia mitskevichiae]|uniref:Uncharacterized protein DUF4292 n=1 Tax=Gillisia mitskevichiae TaxID=270921 RepID=A0A495PY94_9FLAO|nr:DUF4292 domain-containing protein [Gillisia mitskevichiae]RKS55436.1 uncharacterized protein DUF4292 [Gillisia mitskevichiae]
MSKNIFTLILVSLLLIGCGSKKKALVIEDAAVKKVVAMHYNNEPNFKTLNSRLRLQYQDEDRSQSVTVSFRMQKDSAIWMSAQLLGIPLAKVLITQDRVSYYEKIGKTYFDGDYSLVSKWLGTPLDFQKLQNLLIGQAIYDLREDKYVLSESTRGYQLVPSNSLELVKKLFLIDAKSYSALAQQLSQEKENRNVTVTYTKYQKINDQNFPEEIKIVANSEGKGTQIDIAYRSVAFNESVSFPFEIPSGYDEIQIE